jgi:hypothetical protein
VDQTLKGIQSSEDQKFLQSMEKNIWWRFGRSERNRNHWDWLNTSIKKNPSKSNKSTGYEQILRPWLYNFIVTKLWSI